MSLMAVFDDDAGNAMLAGVATIAGTDAATVRTGLDRLCPAIAEKLQEELQDDPELADDLADLLEDNVSQSVAGEDAIVDGKAMLAALYGTQKDAKAQLRDAAPDLPVKVLEKLAPIVAVTVIAAVAQQTRPMGLAGVQTAAGSTSSGVLGTLINAIIASAIKGVIRQITSPRTYRSSTTRRRKTSTSKKRKTSSTKSRSRKSPSRRKTSSRSSSTRSRRNPSISIEDILGGLFGNRNNQE